MPSYEYYCERCTWADLVRFIPYEERLKQLCPACGHPLGQPVPGFQAIGKPAYQMQAVMSNGAHIKGHFGKPAKRDKSGRKK